MDVLYGISGKMLNVFMPYGRKVYWFEAWEGGRNIGIADNVNYASMKAGVAYADGVRLMEQINTMAEVNDLKETAGYRNKRKAALHTAEEIFAGLIRSAELAPLLEIDS